MTMRSSMAWTMGVAALLPACKDDGGGTGTDATTGSSTESTGDLTIDPSTESTSDPTLDPDTSSTSTADSTSTTTDPDTTTGVEPAEFSAFRFDSISVRDPHFFAPVVGDDVTDSQVNTTLNMALSTDEDGDGFLDLGLVLLFRPLDQSEAGTADLEFANAECTAPVETTTCDLLPDTMIYTTTYTNAAGPCLAPNPDELSEYPEPPLPPEASPGPCFESAPASAVLQTTSFTLPLSDARVAATYDGDPSASLLTGNLHGFLSRADADRIMVDVPVFGPQPLSSLLREEDMDGEGWRMHVAFTAATVEWTGS